MGASTPRNAPRLSDDIDSPWRMKVADTGDCIAASSVQTADRAPCLLMCQNQPSSVQSHYLTENDWNDLICSTGFSVVRCEPCVAEPRYVFECFFSSAIGQTPRLTNSSFSTHTSSCSKTLKPIRE